MKAGARARVEQLPVIISRVEEIGGRVIMLGKHTHHYRMHGPHGVTIDYWATTGRWMDPKAGAEGVNRGVDGLILALQGDGIVESRPNQVTIFTDASHDHQTLVGGWAAWCKVGGGRGELISGVLKAKAATTDIAEAMGIANALYAARKEGKIQRGDEVLIQCDCAPALARIHAYVPGSRSSAAPGGMPVGKAGFGRSRKAKKDRKHREATTTQWDDILRSINSLVATMQITLIVRHVKGHSGLMDVRSEINRRCDRAAKAQMRKRRDEMRKEISA